MVTFVTPIVVALIFAGAAFLGLELSSVLGARFLRERTRKEMPRGVALGLVVGDGGRRLRLARGLLA
jgi:enoyl-CoA hydratase/carnithine racemase